MITDDDLLSKSLERRLHGVIVTNMVTALTLRIASALIMYTDYGATWSDPKMACARRMFNYKWQ